MARLPRVGSLSGPSVGVLQRDRDGLALGETGLQVSATFQENQGIALALCIGPRGGVGPDEDLRALVEAGADQLEAEGVPLLWTLVIAGPGTTTIRPDFEQDAPCSVAVKVQVYSPTCAYTCSGESSLE